MEKYLKNDAAEPHLEPCQISIMGHFCKNTTAKSCITDVWYGCKYTTEVVQDSKMNEYQNDRENCGVFKCGLCRRYLYVGISQDIRSSSLHMYYYIVVLKNLAKLTEMHLHQSLFSNCNL